MERFILFLLIQLQFVAGFSQVGTDSLNSRRKTNSDGYYKTENPAKNRFWGNSTYISAAINLSKTNEFDFNIGRTLGKSSGAGIIGYHTTKSWGAGYGLLSTSNQSKQTLKVFYEFDFIPFIIIGNLGLRGEYIYHLTDNQNYLRPSIGWSFLYGNILYNYSFLLNGTDNAYKHGLTIRLKYFISKKNWEREHFVSRY